MAHLWSPASQEIIAGASAWTKPNRKQQEPWRNNTLQGRPGQRPQVQASLSPGHQWSHSCLPRFVSWKLDCCAEIILIFIELSAHARHCLSPLHVSVHLIPKYPCEESLLILSWGKLTPRKGNKVPKGIRLVNSRAGFWTQTGWLQCLSI